MNKERVLNYVGFPILVIAAVLGQYWLWGLLFLWWLVPIIMTGRAFLIFDVHREEDPILFWAIAALWGVFGCMMIAASLFPQYAPWLV